MSKKAVLLLSFKTIFPVLFVFLLFVFSVFNEVLAQETEDVVVEKRTVLVEENKPAFFYIKSFFSDIASVFSPESSVPEIFVSEGAYPGSGSQPQTPQQPSGGGGIPDCGGMYVMEFEEAEPAGIKGFFQKIVRVFFPKPEVPQIMETAGEGCRYSFSGSGISDEDRVETPDEAARQGWDTAKREGKTDEEARGIAEGAYNNFTSNHPNWKENVSPEKIASGRSITDAARQVEIDKIKQETGKTDTNMFSADEVQRVKDAGTISGEREMVEERASRYGVNTSSYTDKEIDDLFVGCPDLDGLDGNIIQFENNKVAKAEEERKRAEAEAKAKEQAKMVVREKAEKAVAEQKTKEAKQQPVSPWAFTQEEEVEIKEPTKKTEARSVSEGTGGKWFGPEDVKEYETALEKSKEKAETQRLEGLAGRTGEGEPTGGYGKTPFIIVSNITQGILDRFGRSSETPESEKVDSGAQYETSRKIQQPSTGTVGEVKEIVEVNFAGTLTKTISSASKQVIGIPKILLNSYPLYRNKFEDLVGIKSEPKVTQPQVQDVISGTGQPAPGTAGQAGDEAQWKSKEIVNVEVVADGVLVEYRVPGGVEEKKISKKEYEDYVSEKEAGGPSRDIAAEKGGETGLSVGDITTRVYESPSLVTNFLRTVGLAKSEEKPLTVSVRIGQEGTFQGKEAEIINRTKDGIVVEYKPEGTTQKIQTTLTNQEYFDDFRSTEEEKPTAPIYYNALKYFSPAGAIQAVTDVLRILRGEGQTGDEQVAKAGVLEFEDDKPILVTTTTKGEVSYFIDEDGDLVKLNEKGIVVAREDKIARPDEIKELITFAENLKETGLEEKEVEKIFDISQRLSKKEDRSRNYQEYIEELSDFAKRDRQLFKILAEDGDFLEKTADLGIKKGDFEMDANIGSNLNILHSYKEKLNEDEFYQFISSINKDSEIEIMANYRLLSELDFQGKLEDLNTVKDSPYYKNLVIKTKAEEKFNLLLEDPNEIEKKGYEVAALKFMENDTLISFIEANPQLDTEEKITEELLRRGNIVYDLALKTGFFTPDALRKIKGLKIMVKPGEIGGGIYVAEARILLVPEFDYAQGTGIIHETAHDFYDLKTKQDKIKFVQDFTKLALVNSENAGYLGIDPSDLPKYNEAIKYAQEQVFGDEGNFRGQFAYEGVDLRDKLKQLDINDVDSFVEDNFKEIRGQELMAGSTSKCFDEGKNCHDFYPEILSDYYDFQAISYDGDKIDNTALALLLDPQNRPLDARDFGEQQQIKQISNESLEELEKEEQAYETVPSNFAGVLTETITSAGEQIGGIPKILLNSYPLFRNKFEDLVGIKSETKITQPQALLDPRNRPIDTSDFGKQPQAKQVQVEETYEWQERAKALIKQRQDEAIEAVIKTREEELQSESGIDFSIPTGSPTLLTIGWQERAEALIKKRQDEAVRARAPVLYDYGVSSSEFIGGDTITNEITAVPTSQIDEVYNSLSPEEWEAAWQYESEISERNRKIRDMAFLGAGLGPPAVAGGLAAAPVVSGASLYAYTAGTTALATLPKWVQRGVSYAPKVLDVAGKAADVVGCAGGDQGACAGGAMGLQMELVQPVIRKTIVPDIDNPELAKFLDEAHEFVFREGVSTRTADARLVEEFVNTRIEYDLDYHKLIFERPDEVVPLSSFCKKGVCSEKAIMGHTILAISHKIPSEIVVGDVFVNDPTKTGRHAWVEFFDTSTKKQMVMDPTWGFTLPVEEAIKEYQGISEIERGQAITWD